MLIQELNEIFQDQAHIFQDTYFDISASNMYHFEHTNFENTNHTKCLQTLFACS